MKSRNFKRRSFFILIVVLLILVPGAGVVTAQTITPGIISLITSELQKRGLTESEVRVRLLQKGIDPEKIPPSELPQYQSRVIAVLDELQAEKRGVNSTMPQSVNNNVPRTNPGEYDSSGNQIINIETVAPLTTTEEAVAEASQRLILAAANKKEGSNAIYGHSLFTDKSLEVFRTTDGAQAPETYVLGDGDEIRITIFGASQTDIQQKIAVDGSIQPFGVAKIFLKGLTLAQARERKDYLLLIHSGQISWLSPS
jgi:hypothetical protein